MDENKKSVLIVDDDDDIRELLRHYLVSQDWRVIEATNGEEAIERAVQNLPDLIVMDLSLPKVDGAEAVRRIYQMSDLRETPVIVISAHGHLAIEFFKTQDIPTGRLLYIAKPFGLSHLDQIIADLFPVEIV